MPAFRPPPSRVPDLTDGLRDEHGGGDKAAIITPAARLNRRQLLERIGGAARALKDQAYLTVAPAEATHWGPWLIGGALGGARVEITQSGVSHAPPSQGCLPAGPAAPQKPWLVVHSSGSTGAPKALVRDRSSWLRCFAAEATLLELEANDRFLVVGRADFSLVPYGVLRALHLGALVGVLPVPTPESVTALLPRVDPTVLYGAPALLVALARCARRLGVLRSVRRIITGGARLSPGQRTVIRAAFPQARIVTFYGAAEVSFIAVRQLDEEPLSPNYAGRLFPNVEATTDSEDRLCVRSPYAVQGRLAESGEIHPIDDGQGWIHLSDLGSVDGAGGVWLAGRADGALDVHGKLMAVDRVERILESEPWVGEAVVLAWVEANHSSTVVAVLVPAREPPPDAGRQLRDRCLRIPRAARPRRLLLIHSPPRTSGGKIDRLALTEAIRADSLQVRELR